MSAAGTILKIGGAGGIFPLPDSMSYQSEYKWETVELGTAGNIVEKWDGEVSNMENIAEIAKDMSPAMQRAFAQGNSAVANTFNNVRQLAPNPKEAINFKGVTFREYNLDFTITGKNAGEIKKKAAFINQLHVEAAPALDGAKYFWKYPPSGYILMFNQGGILFKPRDIYIKSMGIDLNPGGDQFMPIYAGGTPVQMKFSVGIIEKALPSKENDANLMSL